MPASESRLAAHPPEAPDPTTITSKFWLLLVCTFGASYQFTQSEIRNPKFQDLCPSGCVQPGNDAKNTLPVHPSSRMPISDE